ncbi:hypothetical protein Vafri_458, partial [Volvox africanus]
MSAKMRGSQNKQSTINSFFKTASTNAPRGPSKPADKALGQDPADGDDTRPAKKRRIGDANIGTPSTRKRGAIDSAVAAAKPGRGAARSKAHKARTAEMLTIGIDRNDGDAVIDLMDTSATSSDHDVGHRDHDGGESAKTHSNPARQPGGDGDISQAPATAGGAIASAATPANIAIESP